MITLLASSSYSFPARVESRCLPSETLTFKSLKLLTLLLMNERTGPQLSSLPKVSKFLRRNTSKHFRSWARRRQSCQKRKMRRSTRSTRRRTSRTITTTSSKRWQHTKQTCKETLLWPKQTNSWEKWAATTETKTALSSERAKYRYEKTDIEAPNHLTGTRGDSDSFLNRIIKENSWEKLAYRNQSAFKQSQYPHIPSK